MKILYKKNSLKSAKNVFCFVSMVLLLSSCQPKMKTQRVSVDRADDIALKITDEWVLKDTEIAVQDILKQIKNHKGFQSYLANFNGKRPKIFVGEILNQTAEAYFPIGDLNDELLNEFSASGDFILIDAKSREKLLKEITYQNDGMVDSRQAKSIGKASGADLIIFGNVNMKPETLGKKTVKNYTVNLRMTDIETGEEVLRVRFKSSKYSKHSKYSW